ncbi:DUF397 domain-containing protein [Streptomyces sp. NPDC047869]|uniref:DUF397 domain-containing protein n=1 Tax=Streptomyces sp. NPDC047869 TaxID=3154709 RepID=UPI0034516388
MSAVALQWFKSTYSGDEGGQCLEAAYSWFKSSYSSREGGQCLEVAASPLAIHIRDSKQRPVADGPMLRLSPATWAAFTSSLK